MSIVSQSNLNPMTEREKIFLIYGYVRRMAEEAKEAGLFQDMSLNEVITLFVTGTEKERR